MKIIRTVSELKEERRKLESLGLTVGLVPTMGALHDGHLSLINRSVGDNNATIVSVFVNPTQFNNPEDLEKYPRTEEADISKLTAAGVDITFMPSADEVYPEPDNRVFDLGPVAMVMEGKMRPGHFNGVAQIVSRLFEWTRPTRAYFGEKDFQQIAVIRKMAALTGLQPEIVDCPISREPDGLARSSRNVRLSESQRETAPAIHATLKESLEWKKQGKTPSEVIERVKKQLDSLPELETEYYDIVDSETLQPIAGWNELSSASAYPLGCIAIYCGPVRLIDNIKYVS